MRDKILNKLREIEAKENIKIILAIESGSRAWGFASPDSDYDVRFIYVRQRQDYLKLEPLRDVIEWQLDDVYDINGWDIRKTLQLLYKSNPTVFEWCNSPVVYKTSEEFKALQKLLPKYFSVKKGLYHYWHMAGNNYKTYLTGDEVKLKKYFYALRPVLAAKWIAERQCPPPVLFDELAEAELPQELKPEVEHLLKQKKQVSELGTAAKIPVLDEYLRNNIIKVKEMADSIKDEKDNQWDVLNECFMGML